MQVIVDTDSHHIVEGTACKGGCSGSDGADGVEGQIRSRIDAGNPAGVEIHVVVLNLHTPIVSEHLFNASADKPARRPGAWRVNGRGSSQVGASLTSPHLPN